MLVKYVSLYDLGLKSECILEKTLFIMLLNYSYDFS